jgi:hypothetical protein
MADDARGTSAQPPEEIGPQESAKLLGRYGRRFAAGGTIFQEAWSTRAGSGC